MAERIRVLVEDMPAMLRDIVKNLVAIQPDLELVACPSGMRVPQRSRTAPSIIVTAIDDAATPQAAIRWLRRWPNARVLLVSASGRDSTLYELRPHVTPLGELSPQQLIDVIRARPHALLDSVTSGTSRL